MNPYLVLGIPANSDDTVVRRAYLNAIKQSPPEADPQRFQAISQAYEQIKTAANRRRHFFFNRTCAGSTPLEAVQQHAAHQRPIPPLPFDSMKAMLLLAGGVAKPKP